MDEATHEITIGDRVICILEDGSTMWGEVLRIGADARDFLVRDTNRRFKRARRVPRSCMIALDVYEDAYDRLIDKGDLGMVAETVYDHYGRAVGSNTIMGTVTKVTSKKMELFGAEGPKMYYKREVMTFEATEDEED